MSKHKIGPHIDLGKIDLAQYMDAGLPDLKRGMVATVHRPFSWRRPLISWLAWRIRDHSAVISGKPATEHHAMIYAGAGRCWSQDQEYDLVPFSNYQGCRISFFDPPIDLDKRNQIMGLCGIRRGDEYGYRDILGYLLWSLLGKKSAFDSVDDPDKEHCSQAVCQDMRLALPSYGGDGDCNKTPQQLYEYMLFQGWPRVTLTVA
jgi:hypothetical protein